MVDPGNVVVDEVQYLEPQTMPMMDQFGNTYMVPYHDPTYLSHGGFYQQHLQPVVQYVPVQYGYGPMTEEQPYHHQPQPTHHQ